MYIHTFKTYELSRVGIIINKKTSKQQHITSMIKYSLKSEIFRVWIHLCYICQSDFWERYWRFKSTSCCNDGDEICLPYYDSLEDDSVRRKSEKVYSEYMTNEWLVIVGYLDVSWVFRERLKRAVFKQCT